MEVGSVHFLWNVTQITPRLLDLFLMVFLVEISHDFRTFITHLTHVAGLKSASVFTQFLAGSCSEIREQYPLELLQAERKEHSCIDISDPQGALLSAIARAYGLS